MKTDFFPTFISFCRVGACIGKFLSMTYLCVYLYHLNTLVVTRERLVVTRERSFIGAHVSTTSQSLLNNKIDLWGNNFDQKMEYLFLGHGYYNHSLSLPIEWCAEQSSIRFFRQLKQLPSGFDELLWGTFQQYTHRWWWRKMWSQIYSSSKNPISVSSYLKTKQNNMLLR